MTECPQDFHQKLIRRKTQDRDNAEQGGVGFVKAHLNSFKYAKESLMHPQLVQHRFTRVSPVTNSLSHFPTTHKTTLETDTTHNR